MTDRRILVVSPHGDDEVYGCGGMILRATDEGAHVEVVYGAVGGVTYRHLQGKVSEPELVEETRQACAALAVARHSILYPRMQQMLDTVPQVQITSLLDGIIEEGQFTEVYFPYPSHNQDHQAISTAVVAALRPGAHPHVDLVAMYEYVYPGWAQVTAPGGRLYVDISDVIDRKIAALAAYKSQFREPPNPLEPNGIRTLAKLRGLEACVPYAELFHLLQAIHRRPPCLSAC